MRIHNTLICTRPRKFESDGCIEWIESLQSFQIVSKGGLRIRITLMRIRIQIFTLMGIQMYRQFSLWCGSGYPVLKNNGSTRIRICKWTIGWMGGCFVLKPSCGDYCVCNDFFQFLFKRARRLMGLYLSIERGSPFLNILAIWKWAQLLRTSTWVVSQIQHLKNKKNSVWIHIWLCRSMR